MKSEKIEEHVQDLQEVFGVLRKYKVKLNPQKCVFGVVARKFLSFIVSHRGREANIEKIKATIEMQSLSSIKVV